jgi:hypothetical protein
MKPLPTDPNAFRAHAMSLVLDDLWDGGGRCEAVRAVMKATKPRRASASLMPVGVSAASLSATSSSF